MVSKIKEKSIANNAITTSKLSAEVAAVTGIKVSSIVYLNDDTAANTLGGDVITVNGSGFSPTTTVYVDRTQAGVVTYLSNNQITFSSPAKSAGSYILYLYNADGGSAAYIPGINYSGVPAWSTASGSIGTTYEFTSFTGNVSTLSATSDTTVYYLLNSGTLPPGSTLNANTGVISGNTSVINSPTTYNFTIEAKDQENQGTLRNFSITINPDSVTWNSPADSATINVSVGTATTQSLNASSISGKTITYTANTLPTGLSISGNTVTGTPTVVQTITSLVTATAAATNRAATRILNWIVAVANEINFPYVTSLFKTSASSTRSTTVVDSSTNNFTVTRSGAPSTGWTSPYQTDGYWSNYFNGSTDYLSIAANTAFDFRSGDFTIELWVYAPSGFVDYTDSLISKGPVGVVDTSSWDLQGTSGNLRFLGPTSTVYFTTTTQPWLTGWAHIAICRSSSNSRLFVNGTQQDATYTSLQDFSAGNPVIVGSGYFAPTLRGAQCYISNLRIVKGTALYTANFTPSTTPLTAIANTSLLTCQSNRFKDNSTNNFTITPTGTPRVTPDWYPNTFAAPAASLGAGYFNGSTDYLTAPTNTAFAFGTGDFTIEFWSYLNANGGILLDFRPSTTNGVYPTIYNPGGATTIAFLTDSANRIVSASGVIVTGTWIHVAVSRSSGSTKMFVNGSQVGSTYTDSNNYLAGTSRPVIGASGFDLTSNFNGYISNLRLVKGTAVYTANFTPPTAPVTPIANTQLLINFADSNYTSATNAVQNNTFIDSGPYAFPITRTGTPTQGSVTPYWPNGYWSNYFSPTTDYLSIASSANLAFGAGDFTVEGWIYVQTTAQFNLLTLTATFQFFVANNLLYIYDNGTQTSGGTITLNTWYHIAIARSGTAMKCYINGTQVISVTSSTSFTQGTNQIANNTGTPAGNGYISNLRVIKGQALATGSFTSPTAPLTTTAVGWTGANAASSISGTVSLLTCQSNRFKDNSTSPLTITVNGTPKVQAFQPFSPTASYTAAAYGGSGYFNGSTDYLSVASNTALAFGTNNFTIEFWVWFNAISGSPFIYSSQTSGSYTTSPDIYISGGKFYVQVSSANPFNGTGPTTVTTGRWYHVALVKNSGTTTLYVNGGIEGSFSDSNTYVIGANRPVIGVYGYNTTVYYLNGYVSNLRVVNGTAVYTAAFTPPTAPVTAIPNTSLLLNYTNAGIYDAAVQNNVITVGDAQASTTQSKWSPTSMKFDGTGDWLSTTIQPIGSGDFTIEFWMYHVNAECHIFTLGPAWGDTTGVQFIYYSGSNNYCLNVGNANNNFFGGLIQNTWTHVAIVRNAGTVKLYWNGTASATTLTNSTNLTATSLTLGYSLPTGTWASYSGYMQDFRITRGVARYTSNFTVPTAEFIAR